MSAPIEDIAALLEESLTVWHLEGRLVRDGDGLTISVGERRVRIGLAAEDVPFPWMVVTGGKARGVVSLSALLRTVRNALDPEHAGSRLRCRICATLLLRSDSTSSGSTRAKPCRAASTCCACMKNGKLSASVPSKSKIASR